MLSSNYISYILNKSPQKRKDLVESILTNRVKLNNITTVNKPIIVSNSGFIRNNKGIFCKILNEPLSKVVDKIGLTYYINSGSYGHIFQHCLSEDCTFAYAIKVMCYTKPSNQINNLKIDDDPTPLSDYENAHIDNPSRPENVELRIAYLLTDLVNKNYTPHIAKYVLGFRCNIDDVKHVFDNNPSTSINKYYKKKKNKSIDDVLNRCSDEYIIYIAEWANGGDLLTYIIQPNYFATELDKTDLNNTLIPLRLKTLLFQILYTLATIHRVYPGFRHNDLHIGNILINIVVSNPDFYRTNIDETKLSYVKYKFMDHVFYVPFFEFSTLLWDYDFSSIGGNKDGNTNTVVVNNYKAQYSFQNIGISQDTNHYFDMHCCLNCIYNSLKDNIDSESKHFILDCIPDQLLRRESHYTNFWRINRTNNAFYNNPINSLRRLQYASYLFQEDSLISITPEKIITTHPYFASFIQHKHNIIEEYDGPPL